MCLSWKLVSRRKNHHLQCHARKKFTHRVFFDLIAERWFLMHFTKGILLKEKIKNHWFFRKVFSMFFGTPYTSNSLRIKKKNFKNSLRFLRKSKSTIFIENFNLFWWFLLEEKMTRKSHFPCPRLEFAKCTVHHWQVFYIYIYIYIYNYRIQRPSGTTESIRWGFLTNMHRD